MMTERQYDEINNEGADGYNPIRQARLAQEALDDRANVTDGDRRYRLLTIMAATSTKDPMYVELNDQLAVIEARITTDHNTKMQAEWTIELTKSHRETWNTWARGLKGTVSGKAIAEKEKDLGFFLADLKEAVKMHNL